MRSSVLARFLCTKLAGHVHAHLHSSYDGFQLQLELAGELA